MQGTQLPPESLPASSSPRLLTFIPPEGAVDGGFRAERSVVRGLWPIGDEAALQLVTEFHPEFEAPLVTKAQALQHAQLELVEGEASKKADKKAARRK